MVEKESGLPRKRIDKMQIIECTRGNLDIEYNGRILRCWGDMCVKGFSVEASAMEWLEQDGTTQTLQLDERSAAIKEIKKFCKKIRGFKVVFYDERNKKI